MKLIVLVAAKVGDSASSAGTDSTSLHILRGILLSVSLDRLLMLWLSLLPGNVLPLGHLASGQVFNGVVDVALALDEGVLGLGLRESHLHQAVDADGPLIGWLLSHVCCFVISNWCRYLNQTLSAKQLIIYKFKSSIRV